MKDLSANDRVLLACLGIVMSMTALTFASAPLYDLFCRVTGFGGTTQVAERPSDAVLDRVVRIRFDSNVNPRLAWSFAPDERTIDVRVGETGLAFYRARNEGSVPVIGTATFNVTPLKAGQHFVKIECFCFQEQVLKPGETAEFPVVFYVDPGIADDPTMNGVTEITLSYTFFPAEGAGTLAELSGAP